MKNSLAGAFNSHFSCQCKDPCLVNHQSYCLAVILKQFFVFPPHFKGTCSSIQLPLYIIRGKPLK